MRRQGLAQLVRRADDARSAQPAQQAGGGGSQGGRLAAEPGLGLALGGHRQGERVERAGERRPPRREAGLLGHGQAAPHLLGVREGRHDAVGALAGEPQQPRAVGGEPDRRAAGLDRGRLVGGPGERAGHVSTLGVREHRPHHLQRAAQRVGALAGRRERDPVRAVLGHVRAGSQAHHQATARDHVQDRRHLGGQRRGPVAGRQHRHPQAGALGEGGERREGHQGVERRLVLHPPRRLEVVVHPQAREAAPLGAAGERPDALPGRSVLGHPDPDGRTTHGRGSTQDRVRPPPERPRGRRPTARRRRGAGAPGRTPGPSRRARRPALWPARKYTTEGPVVPAGALPAVTPL